MPAVRRSRATVAGKSVSTQVRRGDVDRDRHVERTARPGRGLGQRVGDDALGERAHEARLLDARDERRREQAAVDGVLPAHERLEAAEPAGRHLDLGLEVQLELAARDPGAQLAEQDEAVAAVVVALLAVGRDAHAVALGLVHRDVGALEQLDRRGGVPGEEREADARVDLDRDAVEDERLLEAAAQAPGDGLGRGDVARRAEDDGELVAAEAREQVLAARVGLQARAELLQEQVADVVAERVVELLEAVEVHEQQAGRAPARDVGVEPAGQARGGSAAR